MPAAHRPLPNPLTALRLLLLPALWALALARQPSWLAAGLAIAVLTDVLDGRLARRWPRFADGRLDALADKLLTFSVALWLVRLRPQIFSEHPWLLLTTTLVYAADLIYGWLKFQRVPGLPLHLGKLGGALQAVFVLHALLSGGYSPLLLDLALGVFILAAGEELAILITHREVDEEKVRSIVPYLRARWRAGKIGTRLLYAGDADNADGGGWAARQAARGATAFAQWLTHAAGHPQLPWLMGLLAVVLTLPALVTGFQFDDFLLRAAMRGLAGPAPLGPALNQAFVFMDGQAAHGLAQIQTGAFPWWSLPEGQVAFWRPVAALTHWLDFAWWPASPALMHLHSLLWLGALSAAAAALYRRLGAGSGPAAAALAAPLAGVLYAVDHTHGFAAAWLSNRNILLAALWGVLALSMHARWRRDGWRAGALLAPLLLLLALLSAEAAVAVLAYWFTYALFLDHAPWHSRLLSLAPAALVTAGWRLVYRALGYGLWGTSYIDPFREPFAYVRAILARGPLLLLGQWLLPPAEYLNFLAPNAARLAWVAAVLWLALLAWVFWPLARRSATARFWGAGMLLAVLPASAAVPADRLLFFIGLGAMGLLAEFLAGGLPAGLNRWAAAANHGLTGLLLALHLIVAPVLLALMAFSPLLLGGGAHGLENAVASLPASPRLAQQTAVIVYAPNFADASYIGLLRPTLGLPAPARVRGLASGLGAVRLSRPDTRSLVVSTDTFISGYDSVFRGADHALTLYQTVDLGDMRATIETLTRDGRPATVDFQFALPLEDPSLAWFRWQAGRYVPFTPPAIGATVELDPVSGTRNPP